MATATMCSCLLLDGLQLLPCSLCHCLCFSLFLSMSPFRHVSASCLSLFRSLFSVSMWKEHKTGSQET